MITVVTRSPGRRGEGAIVLGMGPVMGNLLEGMEMVDVEVRVTVETVL